MGCLKRLAWRENVPGFPTSLGPQLGRGPAVVSTQFPVPSCFHCSEEAGVKVTGTSYEQRDIIAGQKYIKAAREHKLVWVTRPCFAGVALT